MTTKVLRKIVRIDEERCNGCEACVPACAEGALQIVDGKARLISEEYCDGLGACLGECPQGAIIIEERKADSFDREAVKQHTKEPATEELPCGCPSATVTSFGRRETAGGTLGNAPWQPSMLSHWPIQLTLVPPDASFLQGADLVLSADCGSRRHLASSTPRPRSTIRRTRNSRRAGPERGRRARPTPARTQSPSRSRHSSSTRCDSDTLRRSSTGLPTAIAGGGATSNRQSTRRRSIRGLRSTRAST